MRRSAIAGGISTLALTAALAAHAQPSTLPPTSPTALAAPAASSPAEPAPSLPAQVEFVHGKLSIVAENSSLNQILRQISHLTAITITGGVADERVFGTYGPGSLDDVLADLLDGTQTNMIFRASTPTRPGELALTPRNGGPTPPNPSAAAFNEQPAESPRTPYQPPTPTPAPAAPVAPTPSSPPDASPSTSTPATPATPEQIYQQLQRLQQAQPH